MITTRALLLFVLLSPAAMADDWPQWRGPRHDGVSVETGWSKNSVTKAWEKQLGVGCSSMAVVGDRVYTMGYDDGRDVVYCFDTNDGSEIWRQTYQSGKWAKMHQGGPASTPAVHDGRVYTLSREAQLYCYDAASGDVLWQKDLADEYGVQPPQWGFAGSPTIIDGMLIIDIGRIISLNPVAGDENWKTDNYGSAYATPTPLTIGRRKLLASFPKRGLVILNQQNGSPIADHPWNTQYGVNATSPVINGNMIFISTGYGTGCAMLQLQGKQLNEIWQHKKMRNKMASSVWSKGRLYGFDEGVLKCLDARTGEVIESKRGLGLGSLMIADDKLIVLSERGELLIMPATPQGVAGDPEVYTKAVSGKNTWVVPVLANGRIYCRSDTGHLVCFDVSQK